MIKKAIFSLSFLTLCGCSSFNLTMKSPRQFRQLKDVPIYISTIKEVKLVDSNKHTMNILMDGFPAEKYQSINDSLILFFPRCTAAIPFSDISKIKCSGIWDDEIGFISKKELMRYDSATGIGRRLGSSIIGGVLGFWGGGYVFIKLTDHSALENSEDSFMYALISAASGAVGGAMICYKLVESSDRRKIIDKIKEERKKGNLQK